MNVLFIGTSDFGGVSSYVSNIVKNSKNVTFFLFKEKFMKDSNLLSLYPNCLFVNFEQNYSFFFLKTIIKLKKHIITNKIDIVHAHTLRAGFQASICKYLFYKKMNLVYTGHGLRYTQKDNYLISLIFMFFEKLVNLISDKVIFIRKIDLDISINKNIVSPDKSIYLKTEISPSGYSLKKNDIRIIYEIKTKYIVINAASIYDLKNPELFIDIAKRTISLSSDITFIWFGDGASRVEINQKLKQDGLSKYIKFVGPVKKDLMLSIYPQIDAFLLTSKIETFPTVILESYMFKKLVFSSNFKGVEEIIKNGETGVIFDKKKPSIISKNIIEILNNKNKYNMFSNKGFDFFQNNFADVIEFAKSHIKIYKKLI